MIAARSRAALTERLELVHEALNVSEVVEIAGPRDITDLRSSRLHYLLDTNQATCLAGMRLAGRRVPFVVDTGDDPACLARNNGMRTAALRGWVANWLLAKAVGVVYRGFFHGPVLRSHTRAPLALAPDTAPDALLDRRPSPALEPVVASFGSARMPSSGDRAYGWEVVDVVAATSDLKGVLVIRGAGIDALRARARRLGVTRRLTIHTPQDLDSLVGILESASVVTSIQTDDLAGWVRTTGKLPLALGMGKMVAASAVGQAVRVLPESFLLPPDDAIAATRIVALARACIGDEAAQTAKRLAEPFRRSTVAESLRRFMMGVSA